MSGFMWVHEAGRPNSTSLLPHQEVTLMLTATRKKVLTLLTAAVLALMLVSTPLGVASTFACDPEHASGSGC